MNKGDLINKLAQDANLTKGQASDAVNCFFNIVTVALQDGDKVSLVGFGTFTPVQIPEKTERSPQTGAMITIPAYKDVEFKPGKELKYSLQ